MAQGSQSARTPTPTKVHVRGQLEIKEQRNRTLVPIRVNVPANGGEVIIRKPDLIFTTKRTDQDSSAAKLLQQHGLRADLENYAIFRELNPRITNLDAVPAGSTITLPSVTRADDKIGEQPYSISFDGASFLKSSAEAKIQDLDRILALSSTLAFENETDKQIFLKSVKDASTALNKLNSTPTDAKRIPSYIYAVESAQCIVDWSKKTTQQGTKVPKLAVDGIENWSQGIIGSTSDWINVQASPVVQNNMLQPVERPGLMIYCVDKWTYEHRTDIARDLYVSRLRTLSFGPSPQAEHPYPNNFKGYMWVARPNDFDHPVSFKGPDGKDKPINVVPGIAKVLLYVNPSLL